MTDSGERRRAPRARFSGIALVRAGDLEISCVARDLSETGMLLFPIRVPPLAPPAFRITFALPTNSRWLEVEGLLVRQKQVMQRAMWAVRFTRVSKENQALLREYVFETQLAGGTISQPIAELTDPEPTPMPMRPLPRSARPPSAGSSSSDLSGAAQAAAPAAEAPAREVDSLPELPAGLAALASLPELPTPELPETPWSSAEEPPPLPSDLEDDLLAEGTPYHLTDGEPYHFLTFEEEANTLSLTVQELEQLVSASMTLDATGELEVVTDEALIVDEPLLPEGDADEATGVEATGDEALPDESPTEITLPGEDAETGLVAPPAGRPRR